MGNMTDGERLAAISATMSAMQSQITDAFRDIKNDLRESRSRHDLEIEQIKVNYAALEAKMLIEREQRLKWENRGAGILIGISALASTIGALGAIIGTYFFGDPAP